MITSQLLINEPPLQVLPTLAQTIGLNEAIILQQIHYWLAPKLNQNFFNGRHWVRNTYEQWQSQFPFWGEKTIRRTISNLEESGILMSFVTRDFKRFKYYSLDYNKLVVLVADPDNNTQKLAVNQGTHPSGHIDLIELPKRADRGGQSDQVDLVNMTRSYDMDSENTNSENTLPPLSPPSTFSMVEKFEEEEEEGKLNIPQNSNSKSILASKKSHEEMLEIWNQTVQCKFYLGRKAHLTPKRAELLNVLMESVFGHQMASWKDYCTLIENSRFLAGENATRFKVTLDWALIPDNAYKVLEGAIYDKPEPVRNPTTILSWEEFSEELVRILPSNKYLLPWLKISLNLAKQIGQVKYKNWFSKVFLSELTDTKAILLVEGNFTKDYIATNFFSEIKCAIQSLRPDVKQIDFQVIQPARGNY